MESKELKKRFGEIAKENDYNTAFGIWYKESSECLFILSLQKSNYSNLFYLNLKIFIQGAFETTYKIDKELKNDTGDIFRRSPKEYDQYFDFEVELSDDDRINGLKKLFADFINPFSEKALERNGILQLEETSEIALLPAVKEELEKMTE